MALEASWDADADGRPFARLINAFWTAFRFHLGDLIALIHARFGATNQENPR